MPVMRSITELVYDSPPLDEQENLSDEYDEVSRVLDYLAFMLDSSIIRNNAAFLRDTMENIPLRIYEMLFGTDD